MRIKNLFSSAITFAMLISVLVVSSAQSYTEISRTSLPGNEGWDYLTMDSGARLLYLSRSTRIVVFNVDTHKVVGEIGGLQGVHGVAIASALGKGFTSNGRDNSVTVFDLKSFKTLDKIDVGKGPDAILYDPACKRVFTFNGGDNSATAIDVLTNKVVGTIQLGGRPEAGIADGHGTIFVNIEDKSEVISFSSSSLKMGIRHSLAPGDGPSGLGYDPVKKQLFSVCSNQKMMITSIAGSRPVADVAIGNGADACVFDPVTHLAFSSNGRDGTLTVVKEGAGSAYTVLKTEPTQPGARTMALDTKTHHIFTCTAKMMPQAPGETNPRRRSYEPGSYVVLEYGGKK